MDKSRSCMFPSLDAFLAEVLDDHRPAGGSGEATKYAVPAPSVGDISAEDLPNLMNYDPVLRRLSDTQKRDLLAKLRNVNSIEFKFATALTLDTSRITKNDYQKTWWLIGPGDQSFTGNEDGYKTTYNCLGQLLMWYGRDKFNGKGIVSNGRSTWPDVPEVFPASELDEHLKKFDLLFSSLGSRGFTRIGWKPDLSSYNSASAAKLPKFEKSRNYIIILGSVRNRDGDHKPVTGIRPTHVFTNFDSGHRWWISKVANGGTFLHGIDGLSGDDEVRSGLGCVVAIYEENAK